MEEYFNKELSLDEIVITGPEEELVEVGMSTPPHTS